MRINVDGVYYHYSVNGQGEPLVLLHGFTGSSSTWEMLSEKLQKSFQVICVDIIGHGQTDSPAEITRYRIEKVAMDIFVILESLCIEKTHLLGYSMGGRVALTMASLFPNRINKLILESSSPGLEEYEDRQDRMQQDEKLAKFIEEHGILDFVQYWENIPLFSSQKQLSHNQKLKIREERLAQCPHGLANSLRGMGTGSQPSWWDALKELHIPVLLITGELDKKFFHIASRMQKILENAKLVECANVGHAIHVEDPRFFGTIVEEFLKRV